MIGRGALAALAIAAAGAGCISSYQTARVLPPGETSLTVAYSNVRNDEEFTEGSADAVDVIARHGMSEKFELGVRYTDAASTNTVGIEPKLGLMPDRVAVAVPIKLTWADDLDGFDYGFVIVQPELIGSVPLSPNAELTGTAKLMLVFPDGDDSEQWFGFDAGVRLSTDLSAWAFYPSIGVLHFDQSGGSVNALSFGAALSFHLR